MSSISDISSVVLNTNKFTLEYLTNPLYQKEFKHNTKLTDELNKEQCSFYKKRIISITKEMLKGEYYSENLKKIHNEYIQSLINHFKRVDEIEIIQQEYSDISFNKITDLSTNVNKINVNLNEIIMKKNKPVSIDNFVTKKVIQIKKEILIPKKRVLNVNTPAHKIKGIPLKHNKDKV
jgi:hypothetical protein